MQMKDKIEGLACDAIHLRDLIKLVRDSLGQGASEAVSALNIAYEMADGLKAGLDAAAEEIA